MHAQSAGEPERSDLRLLGAFMHAQSAGEPERSDLRLLGAFMHAQSAGERQVELFNMKVFQI
ncbi:hypothetical protein EDM25_08240 [Staphylococcus aureus]|nr:hypothetical protein [Staphylococcus aureus]MBH9616677.1 hypothetical protein [Staphylococcus aureus]OFC54111.1 hypothetical protein BA764_08130 [Staphylococcus aureus]RNB31384.1 hypothetical protein EDM25_08240 [Staphylococcus aureus]